MFGKLFGSKGKKPTASANDPGVRVVRKGAEARDVPLVPPIPSAPLVEAEREPSPEETRALLQQALADAEMELDRRRERDRRDPEGASKRQDKQHLITAAMAVHRMKQSAFSELDPKTRDRLRSFAERTMGVGKPAKK